MRHQILHIHIYSIATRSGEPHNALHSFSYSSYIPIYCSIVYTQKYISSKHSMMQAVSCGRCYDWGKRERTPPLCVQCVCQSSTVDGRSTSCRPRMPLACPVRNAWLHACTRHALGRPTVLCMCRMWPDCGGRVRVRATSRNRLPWFEHNI